MPADCTCAAAPARCAAHGEPHEPVYARHRRIAVEASGDGYWLTTSLGTCHSSVGFFSAPMHPSEAAALRDADRFAYAVHRMDERGEVRWSDGDEDRERVEYAVDLRRVPAEVPPHACASCTEESRRLNREQIEARIARAERRDAAQAADPAPDLWRTVLDREAAHVEAAGALAEAGERIVALVTALRALAEEATAKGVRSDDPACFAAIALLAGRDAKGGE